MPSGRWARAVRLGLRGVSLAVMILTLAVLGRWWTGNQGTVVPGAVYRSGQLTSDGLERTIRSRGIRTVLNLRGCNPEQAWYRAERTAALRNGALQVDVAMASDQWMSRVQLDAVLELLRTAPRPLLIHCEWGAERTGLTSALAVLLTPGGSVEAARGQFSTRFLFLPVKDGRMMIAHLDQYARWLARQRRPHSPELLREWSRSGYRPGTPSREDWPYDPYPLVVTTRPPAPVGGPPGRIAGREAASPPILAR